jgi:hypothetical protein
MGLVSWIPVGIFFLFFVVNFFLTQVIYSKGYFWVFTVFSLLLPFALFLFIKKETRFEYGAFGLIFFYFNILLILVKIAYKKINSFLIKVKMIKPKYAGKDFTYVLWDSDTAIDDFWNEKLAGPPSWFDYLLTILLLMGPILIATGVIMIAK